VIVTTRRSVSNVARLRERTASVTDSL
jgi:hypothetical protein